MPTYNYNYKIGISDTTTFSTNSIVDTVVFPAGGFYENPFPKSAVFYENGKYYCFCLNNFTDPITNQTYAKYYTSTDGINWTPQNFDSHEGLINSNAVFSSLALMPTNKSWLAFTGSGSPFLLNNEPDFFNPASVATDGTKFLILESGTNSYYAYLLGPPIGEILGRTLFATTTLSARPNAYFEKRDFPVNLFYRNIRYLKDKWYAVASWTNILLVSSDGLNWSIEYLPWIADWRDIASDGSGNFYIVCAGMYPFTGGSLDPASTSTSPMVAKKSGNSPWASVQIAPTLECNWQKIVYGGGKFVAVGSKHVEYIYTSASPLSNNFDNAMFLDTASATPTWGPIPSWSGFEWHDLVFQSNKFLATSISPTSITTSIK